MFLPARLIQKLHLTYRFGSGRNAGRDNDDGVIASRRDVGALLNLGGEHSSQGGPQDRRLMSDLRDGASQTDQRKPAEHLRRGGRLATGALSLSLFSAHKLTPFPLISRVHLCTTGGLF